MVQYSHIDASIRRPGKMIQYSHTDVIEDNLEYDRRCPRMYERQRLQNMIQPRLMMNMKDDVPNLPMTYRV